MNNNGGDNADKAGEKGNDSSAGDVKIQRSETGRDPEVGHTPGKAEGVTTPEAQGNE